MIKLDVKALKEEKGRQEHYGLSVQLPGLDDGTGKIPFAGPVNIHMDLTNTGLGILAAGEIETAVEVSCARCLKPFKYHIHTNFIETYYNKEKGVPATGDAEDFIPFRGDEIDIQPEVIKAILLAMPIKVLCDPECRGLCSLCGCNLNTGTCDCHQENIDPRMAKLKELLK